MWPGLYLIVLLVGSATFIVARMAVIGHRSAGPDGQSAGVFLTKQNSARPNPPPLPAKKRTIGEPLYREIDQRGKSFYTTYEHLLSNYGKTTVDAGTVARQLAPLATLGEPPNARLLQRTDPEFRLMLKAMVRDAERLAVSYAEAASGRALDNSDLDLTPIINSFTNVLVECARCGWQPRWFKIGALPKDANYGAN